jgi:Lon protease-like protein
MARSLPDTIPLFPLPNVVHFPRVLLPLHIFEPRYRAMVRDALQGARLIGMVLLRGDWQADYLGTPPIFQYGTAGEIVRSEELPDGRFNIILRGAREFRVRSELMRALYREAMVEWRYEETGALVASQRERLAALVGEFVRRRHPEAAGHFDPPSDDELFVNAISQQLDLPVIERQALLEANGLSQRAERLIEVLDFHVEALRSGAIGTARPQ